MSVHYPIPGQGWAAWFRNGYFCALSQVSFQLQRGPTLGVIGQSGSGKSSLALTALHLLPKGSVSGIIQPHLDQDFRRRAQVVFQDPFSSLSPRMTIEQIVGEGLRIHSSQLG